MRTYAFGKGLVPSIPTEDTKISFPSGKIIFVCGRMRAIKRRGAASAAASPFDSLRVHTK